MADLLERHKAFWTRSDAGKPLLRFSRSAGGYGEAAAPMEFPLADGSMAQEDVFYLEPDMLSPRRLHPGFESVTDHPETFGDLLAVQTPFVRVPWMEAILGCPIRVSRHAHSARADHVLGDDWFDHLNSIRLDEQWIHKLSEFIDFLSNNARGHYLVANALMRGPSDMVEALIGASNLCDALYEHPEAIDTLLKRCTDLFIRIAEEQLLRTQPFQGGYCNFFGIWAPGKSIRTQDDASALLSPRHYREFLLPHQEHIASSFPYSTMHMHSGALHALDAILESSVSAVQIQIDPIPYGPAVPALVPTFLKVQQRKPLLIEGPMLESELELLLMALSPRGLYIWADLESAEDRRQRE